MGENKEGYAVGGVHTERFVAKNSHEVVRLPLQRIEFGNTRSEWTRLSDLNRLEQTRQTYDPDAIRELADSMVYHDEHGDKHFELINDPVVAVYSDEELPSFLSDFEEHHGKIIDLSGLVRGSDGLWHIAVAGHRRSLAMELLCKENFVETKDAFFPSSVHRNMSFEDFLVQQLRENIHVRPPKVEEARQISLFYASRTKKTGKEPSYKECSRILGFSPEVISEAVRFARLPIEVQREASASMISYAQAVALSGYADVLHNLYRQKYAAKLDDEEAKPVVGQHVMHSCMTAVKTLKAMSLMRKSAEDKSRYVKGLVNNAKMELDGEAVFIEGLVYEDSPEAQHRRANVRALSAAIDVIIRWGAEAGEVSESQVQQLFMLAKAAKSSTQIRAIAVGETYTDPEEIHFSA